jgi:lipid II:glycine glycyltransferase (peptidoglycan interpeptide bridge formation enzyme)
MTSAGRKAKSKKFFVEFLRTVPNGNWIILEAYLEEERVASLLLIFTSDIVEYFTPVILDGHKHLQPLSLLIFYGFVFANQKQIRYWNWGGTWMTQSGVYKFKKQWNPKETEYSYYTKVLDETILNIDGQTLMSAYPFFYVYPMDQT